ncbi:hypothetical protein K227x_15130 [Rubripirellula lacrimiformis]|uniref:Uncharacterized protein n=1 Tax=Rubripirellula lacrimiformis TaxID=1930273 RepID=A0A517N7M2_9BACT|nr:hypothetical protein [Rubripirellula lacrimiformis]QDT03132.1 hypothetical protein K227x_15130 [Rubripirellula lacrimiformis]
MFNSRGMFDALGMPETMALTRLAISRSRTAAIVLLGIIVIGCSIVLAIHQTLAPTTEAEDLARYSAVIIAWTFLPAGIASLVLFDFSSGNSVNLPESNCSHFVLRMPIRSWKIAVVPLLLKTAWISMVWCLGSGLVRHFVGATPPIVIPCFAFSAVAMWLMAIAWRPFKFAWTRFIWIALAAVVSYAFLLLYFAAPTMPAVGWRPLAIWSSAAFAVINWGVAMVAAVMSIEKARTSAEGITSTGMFERGIFHRTAALSNSTQQAITTERQIEVPVRTFASPVAAIAWFELTSTRDYWLRTLLVGTLPLVLILTLATPFHAAWVAMALISFAVLAGISVSVAGESPSAKLPPILVRSPVSDAAIAWTRAAVSMSMAACMFAFILLAFAGWAIWPSNREIWIQWSQEIARQLDAPAQAINIGLAISLMIVIGFTTVAASFAGGLSWAGSTGRDWVAIPLAFACGIGFLVPIGIISLWLAHQSDWESARASLVALSRFIRPAIIALLVTKLIVATGISIKLRKLDLARPRSICTVWIGWVIVSIGIGGPLAFINPFAIIESWHWVSMTACLIPLGGILMLPLSAYWNRHR